MKSVKPLTVTSLHFVPTKLLCFSSAAALDVELYILCILLYYCLSIVTLMWRSITFLFRFSVVKNVLTYYLGNSQGVNINYRPVFMDNLPAKTSYWGISSDGSCIERSWKHSLSILFTIGRKYSRRSLFKRGS